MFKKIQKKLLLNYPLLWNIKVIPMVITIVGFNVLYFFLGFISGAIDFQKSNYYNNGSFTIFFLVIILTSILTLILWLVYYLKNNGFKSFYPKKGNSLYWEWLLTFLLLFGICSYPFSYFQGIQAKERSYATKEEVLETKKFLNKIDILIPESDTHYYNRTIVPDSANTDKTSNSISISLLNFDDYSESSDIQQVKRWLVEEKQDSIRNLLHQYFKLQEKYKLTSNLTVDSWMKLIYNPPTYEVSPSNYILKNKINFSYNNSSNYYVEYYNLTSGYNKIYNAHYDNDSFYTTLLLIFYIALSLSLFLLSFRITSGKSWLIALVVIGLLALIYGIVSAIHGIIGGSGNGLFFLTIIYWVVIFFIMIFYVGSKIYCKSPKGKSTILIHLILWMLPYVFMLLHYMYIESRDSPDIFSTLFNSINLIFVCILLLPLTIIIKKWKALPEE
ncbi:hypothetical protein [Apibacter sp. HY039]|uniref:hypothetical protein n=1 Tax=Apibacter sp. HY039 TaxID=2501476 RepID=UPI000FEB92C0|nr:hypothetical protein [Apibacter sp. HY039]